MSAVASIVLGPLARTAGLDLVLAPGRTLAGLVAERRGDHGILVLAGTPVVAELPPQLEAGARLRLRVTEAGPERVALQVVPDEAPATAAAGAAPPPPPPAVVPLPGGVRARVQEEDAPARGGDGPERPAVSLRLEAPHLGRIDLRVAADAVAVHLAEGAPAALARACADELAGALGGAAVTVHPRRAAVDRRA